ncbi:MAG: IspD/TarI family cytidylyltransferase [Verrucomicrobiota bacterium]
MASPSPGSSYCNRVILLSAGKGNRMKGAVTDKILVPIEGKSSFRRSFEAFAETGIFDEAVVVYRDAEQRDRLKGELADLPDGIPTLPCLWTQGGARRQDSVFRGLTIAGLDTDYIFIHDCARPLVRSSDIQILFERVLQDKAASLARPVTDTLNRVDRRKQQARLCRLRPIDRRGCWAMETPQAFAFNLIFDAYQRARQEDELHTDDCSVATADGARISLVEPSFPNIKITKPGDLVLASFLIQNPNFASEDPQ